MRFVGPVFVFPPPKAVECAICHQRFDDYHELNYHLNSEHKAFLRWIFTTYENREPD